MTACRNIVAINYNWAMINRPRIPWLVTTCSVLKEKDETYHDSLCEEQRATLASFLSWAVNGGVCSAEENSACPTNFSMVTAAMSTAHCPQAARCRRAVRILQGNVCAQFSIALVTSLSQQVSQALLSKHTPLATDVYQFSSRISGISYLFTQNLKTFKNNLRIWLTNKFKRQTEWHNNLSHGFCSVLTPPDPRRFGLM